MSVIEEMTETQRRIDDLRKKHIELRKNEKAEKIEEILKMDWLKGKTVSFDQGILAAGMPEFVLILREEIPILKGVLFGGGSICLYGDNKLYENNITLFRKEFWEFPVYTMETSNGVTLGKFIRENNLKIGDFSANRRAAYTAIMGNLAD